MYHFVGIKGSGMSSLAILMKQLGYIVQGSDYDKHYFTEDGLKENKIKVLSFNKKNIKNDMIIVKGNMFDDNNIELLESKKKGLKVYTYQEMIAHITSKFNLIAVSGCHGKTTTSSLLAHIINSNYLIGDGSGGIGDNNYFVLEACEYKRHFLSYNPNCAIITNIDLDHVDYYRDIFDVINAYQEFINKSKLVILCGDDNNTLKLNHDNIYTYGINNNNFFKAKNIEYRINGISYDFYEKDNYIYHFDLPFYGKHMVLNTLAVISFCYLENINFDMVYSKLLTFKGAKRRFCEKKVLDNVIIDDYAHHPNEIEAVIDSCHQKYPNKELIAIFEPHTYSRTEKFALEIASKLNMCDYVYVMDIYKSRENQEDYPSVTSDIIITKLNHGEYINDVNKLLKYHDTVLLFMSPNDLSTFENKYIDQYINSNRIYY